MVKEVRNIRRRRAGRAGGEVGVAAIAGRNRVRAGAQRHVLARDRVAACIGERDDQPVRGTAVGGNRRHGLGGR